MRAQSTIGFRDTVTSNRTSALKGLVTLAPHAGRWQGITMESQNTDAENAEQTQDDGTPVCLRCCRPIDPLAHYCSYCGEASGKFTTYLPYECIPWEARIYGQMWHQVWSNDVSILGRIFRFLFLVWFCPFILIGLVPKLRQYKSSQHEDSNRPAGAVD